MEEQQDGKIKKSYPRVAFTMLNFFMRNKKAQVAPEQKSLTSEEIRAIFQRSLVKLRAIYRLNKLSEEIVHYGTSSNLFDLSTRDRPALQRYLFPLSQTKMEQQQLEFLIIHPASYFKQFWNVVFVCLMIYTSTLLPFRISFYLDQEDYYWYYVDISIDILFWLDLFVNLCSAFYDEEGKLILSRRTVMLTYCKGWFALDFISCFPLQYILDATTDSSTSSNSGQNIKLVKLVKLPRLYRLFKMARMIKLIKLMSKSDSFEFIKMNYGFTRLFNLFITVCLFIHFMGCVWHYIAAFNDYDLQTWVYRNGLINTSTQTKYIASIYYSFTTLTTVGYGDIHAKSTVEMILTIVLMIVGVCFYSFTIGLLTSVLSQIDYRAHTLTKKKAILNEFCKEKKISKILRDKLKQTLEYNFNKNCFIWAYNTNIFEDLPINLRYDIMMNIHGGVFGHMQLFQLVEDKAFLVKVVPLLKPLAMDENETIWEANSNPDAMYFLADGRVNFKKEFIILQLTSKSKLFSFKSMISGSYFGDIEIFRHTKRQYNAVCESKCELYYLSLDDFDTHIFDDFPHVMDRMRKIAQDRYTKNDETIMQLQQFISDETTSRDRRKSPKRKTFLRDLVNTPIRKQDPQRDTPRHSARGKDTPRNADQNKDQSANTTSNSRITDLIALTNEIQTLLK